MRVSISWAGYEKLEEAKSTYTRRLVWQPC